MKVVAAHTHFDSLFSTKKQKSRRRLSLTRSSPKGEKTKLRNLSMSSSLLARGVLAALSRSHSTMASSAAQAAGAASASAVRRGAASMPAVASESDGESSSSQHHEEGNSGSPRWLRELGVVRNDWT